MARHSGNVHELAMHESKVIQAVSNQFFQGSCSAWALDGNQAVVVNDLEVNVATLVLELDEVLADMHQIFICARRVGYDVEAFVLLHNNGIVNDTALLICEYGKGALTDWKLVQICDDQSFKEFLAVLADHSK